MNAKDAEAIINNFNLIKTISYFLNVMESHLLMETILLKKLQARNQTVQFDLSNLAP